MEKTARCTYDFWPTSDQDLGILDDRVLALSCDDDTWLYKVGDSRLSFQHELQSKAPPTNNSAGGGSVDSRTFTRRKHGHLRTSFDSPLANNRSSLGLLSPSKLINDSLEMNCKTNPSQEKSSSNSIASDEKPVAPTVFKLDSPFMNSMNLEKYSINPRTNSVLQRFRFDSELSESSIPLSLDNFSPFEKNEVMTDSMVNFLEKEEIKCCPPTAFQDDESMSTSIISIPENQGNCSIVDVNGKSEEMTASLVNFLEPINCKPPSGFEDSDMVSSVVNVHDADALPSSDMTKSLMDYLENSSTNVPLKHSTMPRETENIPPSNYNDCNNQEVANLLNHPGGLNKCENENTFKIDKLNSTYELKQNSNNKYEHADNITFTNSVNISRGKNITRCNEESLNLVKSNVCRDNTEKRYINRTINHNDLNVTKNINKDESNETNHARNGPNKVNSTLKRYGTYLKSESHDTLNVTKQIPLRNSTFNTTFTKLESPISRGLNSTFTKSTDRVNGGLEDDQTSSASDSSLSSGSTKPRSVDELRNIAGLQVNSSTQYSSTPVEVSTKASGLSMLDNIELSPISRPTADRSGLSRSANCSPVRSLQFCATPQHKDAKLRESLSEGRRKMLQASSLSNIARPKVSGLRMPQPVSRLSVVQKVEPRPPSAPIPPPTGIPRFQASRLPMPRFRTSGIPGPKRGGKNH